VNNNTSRRKYTIEQYRADLAALDLRHHDAPALRRLLDEQITASLELPPVSAVVRRPTLLGGLIACAAESAKPVSAAVLRAVGLSPRPSGRLRCGLLPVLLAVAAVLLAGCAGEITTPTTDRDDGAALHVWPANNELRVHALGAADRILFATGLVVVVDETPTPGAVPLFWSDVPNGDAGLCVDLESPDMLLVSPGAPPRAVDNIVLHEILHGIGAQHVREPGNVLSQGLGGDGAERLTAADLEAVCAVRECSAFVLEG
jgi:hypothetical protein